MMSMTIASTGLPNVTATGNSGSSSPASQDMGLAAIGKDSPDAAKAGAPTAEELGQAVESIRSSVQSIHRNLDFSVDQDSGLTIVKVVDSESGDVIRQIPSEVAVKLAESLKEASNLLFSERA